jgi:hypothetical protein
MTIKIKYEVIKALKVIDGTLASELNIHRFDNAKRSKAQLFAVNGAMGRQFGIVVGDTDVETGHHPAQQTRILLERCDVPPTDGVERMDNPYNGSRIKTNQDCNIAAPNQVSFLVAGETALTRLLQWYARDIR